MLHYHEFLENYNRSTSHEDEEGIVIGTPTFVKERGGEGFEMKREVRFESVKGLVERRVRERERERERGRQRTEAKAWFAVQISTLCKAERS